MSDFIPAFRVYKPRETAPDFIIANGEIDANALDVLMAWVHNHANAEGKVRFNIKESKEGKFYAALDTYQSKPKEAVQVEISEEEIPF